MKDIDTETNRHMNRQTQRQTDRWTDRLERSVDVIFSWFCFQAPLVPFVTGPGYILSKSKSKFAVTIKEEFFDPVADESQK